MHTLAFDILNAVGNNAQDATFQSPQDLCLADATLLCRYRHRTCTNVRAVKLDGMLHHLCQMHRMRANQNQRRSQSRRRAQQRFTPYQVLDLLPEPNLTWSADLLPDLQTAQAMLESVDEHVPFEVLPLDDLDNLFNLLFEQDQLSV